MSNSHSNHTLTSRITNSEKQLTKSTALLNKNTQPITLPESKLENQIIQQTKIKFNSKNVTDTLNSLNTENTNSITSVQQTTRNYTLGASDKFWVENLQYATDGIDNNHNGKTFQQGDWAEAMYQVTGILINITQHAYIFVDQKIAGGYTTLGPQIGQIFEKKIYPSDSKLGIPININQYDQNGRTIILIFPFIQVSQSSTVVGYFWPLHMHKPSTDNTSIYYYSNYAEMIQIDSNSIPNGDWEATLAHEYFHLIHYNYNPNEDVWLEEGLAVFAEHLAGFNSGYTSYLQDIVGNGFFLHAFDESLTYFAQTLEHYGNSFLFVLYFYEQFGLNFIKDIVQFKDLSGIQAFKYELAQVDPGLSFAQIYNDWVITNVINNQGNQTYSYQTLKYPSTPYKVSQNQYNKNKQFQIVPSSFNDQILPYWSNEYYTLPENNLQAYLMTFMPELPTNTSYYQLTLLTSNNGSWEIEKIPLVNSQSGSFIVQYENRSVTKLLIISSLTGTSSGTSIITDNQMSTTYFSRYNINLADFSYDVKYKQGNLTNLYPNYYFTIYSKTGEIIPQNGVKNISISVFKWNTTTPITGLSQSISFDQTYSQWLIKASNFDGLPLGQYYFTLTIKLVNDQTFTTKGLTFLVGAVSMTTDTSTSRRSTLSSNLPFISIALFAAIVLLAPVAKMKKKHR